MKKMFVSLCMAATVMGVSSCASIRNAATLSTLDGEWNIIEINGTAVVPASGQEFPFIGFDTKNGRVYGHSGCNRMMGTIDVNAKPGTLSLGALAGTRMMCPDMTLEKNVFSALAQVKKYKRLGKENVVLCGSSKRPVVVLQKKAPTVSVSELEGKWMISEVNGEPVPQGMEKQPYLQFSVSGKKVHGTGGCNILNGTFEAGEAASFTFGQMMSTMMAGPGMEMEGKVTKAMGAVRSFGKLAGGGFGFYDADSNLVLVLVKE